MILLNQGIQDPTMIGVEGLKGLQSEAQQNQPKSIYIPSIEEAKQMNVLGRDLRNGLEGIQTPQGFGKSVYDQRVSNLTEVQNLQDFRANEQSGMLKLLNGISKGIALAGTTFLDGTVGLVTGIANMPDKGLAGLWDNNVSNALNDLNKKMEEWLPNYRTVEEEQSPWYENLGTMNFWADSFIKNLGFTVGAYYSGAAWTKALKAAGALKGALSAEVVGSLTSAINEGRIEATHNVGDWKQLQAQQIADARDKALSQLLPDSPLYAANVALINQSYDKQMKELDERASSMGNGILLANTMLLFYNNFKTYGKLYAQGFKNAERKLLSDRVVKDGTNYVWNDVTKKRAIANGLRTGVREGLEEMNQALISESAGYMQTPDSPDAYYKAMIDPDADLQTSQFFDAVTRGFVNTYGNGQKWEEGVIGALTGLLGMPTFGRINNSGTETYLGKNKWIGLSGGLFGEFKSADFANAEGSEAVRIMNNYAEKIRDQKGHFVQGQSFANAMDGWSAENNAFEYKNAEDNDDFAAISAYAKVGRLSDLKDLVNQDFENISDDQLVEIANFTSESQTDPTKPVYGGWRNSDGSLMSDTEEGRQKMREKLVNQRNSILKNIDAYEESVETVRAITNNAQQISEDQINELAWLYWKIGRFKDRFNELKEENAPLFKAYLDGIHEYIKALDEAESEEAAIHEVFIREDPEYYINDKDYEEGLKETNKVRKALVNMASFIDKLQTTNEPLSLALLIFDKEFKKYVGEIFSEQNFDFFTMLGNGNLPYAQAKKLFNDLQDLSKMVTASEQFNERYKEFIEDPLKIGEHRKKQEAQVQNTRDDKAARDLASKLEEDFEGTLQNIDIDEAAEILKNAPTTTPEIESMLDKVEQKMQLDTLKQRVAQIVNESAEASSQVKDDVRALLDKIDSSSDLFAFDSALYNDSNSLYSEEDTSLMGKSNAEIRAILEDRLNEAKQYINMAKGIIDNEDANLDNIYAGSIADDAEAAEVAETGNDLAATIEAVETAGADVTMTPQALTQDGEYFVSNLSIDVTNNKAHIDAIQKLATTINELINKGKGAKDIATTLNSDKNYTALKKSYPDLDLAIAQYIADKTDDIPVNAYLAASADVVTSIQKENDKSLIGESSNKEKKYWSPIQSLLPIHSSSNSTTPFYELVGTPGYEGYSEAQIKYIKAVGEYLAKKGAWERIDSGLVKANEEIHFTTDSELNEAAGAFVILITDKEGNILGNLPTEVDNEGAILDKTFGTYARLKEFADYAKSFYIEKQEMPSVVSHLDKWMIGKIPFTNPSEKHTVQDIFTTTNTEGMTVQTPFVLAVAATNKSGETRIVKDSNRRQDTVEDPEILKPISLRNGQPFILYPTGNNSANRRYIAVPVMMRTFDKSESQLNNVVRARLTRIFSLPAMPSQAQIGKAKQELQEVLGGRFNIQVTGFMEGVSSELKPRITISIKNSETGKWDKIHSSFIENQDNINAAVEACINYLVGKVPYQMSLKYINKQMENADYNSMLAPYIETNIMPGFTHTLSNWFTIRPLQKNDRGEFVEIKAEKPKSVGRHPAIPTAPGNNLFGFTYKGNPCSVDTSTWENIYYPKDGKMVRASVHDGKGNLNINAAQAAAYAFGLISHQDMTKPYKTQWGMYDPISNIFVKDGLKPAEESVTNDADEAKLDELARDGGLLIEKLDEQVWNRLPKEVKKYILEERNMPTSEKFAFVKGKYNARTKKFSVDDLLSALDVQDAIFRKATTDKPIIIDINAEVKWLGTVLPQFNTIDRLKIVDAAIKVASSKNGEYAWGQFKKGVIYIWKGAAQGTMYHEAFHAVTHTLLDAKELESLYNAAKAKYGNKSKLALEESLAEDLRRYIQYEEDPNANIITKWFRRLKHFIKHLFGKERYIDNMFYRIARGKFADRQVGKTNATNNRIINVDFEIDELKREISDIRESMNHTLPQVSDLYSRWREAMKVKQRVGYYDSEAENWLKEHNMEDVAEIHRIYNRSTGRDEEGYIKAITRNEIERIAARMKAEYKEEAINSINQLQEKINQYEADRSIIESNNALEEQEMNDYATIREYHASQQEYNNLSQEDKDLVQAKGLSLEDFDSLTIEEKENMLFCR